MKLPSFCIRSLIINNERTIVLLSLLLISLTAFVYFYQKHQILLYGDALSRMNISRKIIDNLTPGFAQLGNVWLPLPQILMLPFVSNKFLWQTGIGGAIVSMGAFISGGYFLFKSAKILTNSFLSALIALSIYALNTNLLLLQTTAMSETIFLCSLAATTYYFLAWIKSGRNMYFLMLAAISVGASTLIRYEALSILIASILMVFLYTYLKGQKYKTAEGDVFLYSFLACFGFVLWTLYLTAIFGDPLYWKNYYAGTKISDTGIQAFTESRSLLEAVWIYITAVVWMNGIIPTLLAVCSIPIVIYKSITQKSFYFLPLFLLFSIFVFMVLTLQRNTPIHQPDLNITNILSTSTFQYPEFNIRYGILMLPMITLLCSYLIGIRILAFKVFIFAILCIQFFTYIYPSYAIIFQLPLNVAGNITQGTAKEKAMADWMKNNYHNDGLIMISALKHDPQMLQMGFDYKTFIHEGTGLYWKESQKNPQRYASWVVFDSYNKQDQVTKFLSDSPNFEIYYNRVYDNDGMYIYKIKTKPDILVKQ